MTNDGTPAPEAQPEGSQPTPERGTAEYDAEMAESFFSSLPEQFKGDPSKLLDSWKETKADHTRISQELAEFKKATEPEVEPAQAPDPNVPPVDTNPLQIPDPPAPTEEFNWSPYEEEIKTTGTLTEESRTKLKEATNGVLNENIIDNYVQSVAIMQKQAAARAEELVGGPEALSSLMKWAGENLSAPEKDAINAGLADKNLWMNTLIGLQAQKASKGRTSNEPQLNMPTTGQPQQITARPFATETEMHAAMTAVDNQGRKLYTIDPEYRKKVEDRLRAGGATRVRADAKNL